MKHRHAGVHAIDSFAHASAMNGWNAGYKTALSLGTLALCLAADKPLVSCAVIAAMAALIVVRGGLPLGHYVALLRVPLAFLLMSGLAVACEVSAVPHGAWNVTLPWFAVSVTRASLAYAAALSLKALGAVSALYLLALTTPADELTSVLRRAHLPGIVVELMYLIYRFLFILLDLSSRMQEAAASRMGYHSFRASMRTFGWLASSLLIRALRKSGTYYDAMVSRCYDGGLEFLETDKPVQPRQIVGMLALWAGLAALWQIG